MYRDIERNARKVLSNNFEGKPNKYNGENDPYLAFGTAKSFASEKRNGMQFAFKVHNTTGEDKKVCICPANFDTLGVDTGAVDSPANVHYHSAVQLNAAGHVCDAVLDDGKIIDIDTTHYLEVSTPKAKVQEMLDFVKRNPTRVIQIVVQANDISFFEGSFSAKDVNPFRMNGEEVIPMTDSFDPMQNQDRKILIDTDEYNLQLDDQTLLFLDIPGLAGGSADVEAIVTLKVGAIENSAKALKRKAIASKQEY